VKLFEDEIKQLREKEVQLTNENTSLTAAMKKADLHVKELEERCERAEEELKERDAMELKKISPTEERAILKGWICVILAP
jgi:hypothetical protein